MSKWQYTKGLHDLGNGCFAYLQPDGSWGWSNAGLIVDGDQTLLVDTLFDLKLTGEMLGQMRAAVPAANSIGRLVNTHANGDHTFGNQLVAGAEIIASRACAEEMKERPAEELAAMQRNWRQLGEAGAFLHEVMGSKFKWDDVKNTPPTRVFEDELRLKVGDKEVLLKNVGPAHTRGDVLVHVPQDRTVFTGDILFVEGHPVLWAGPIDNWVAACDRILAWDVETVVPGHGPIADKAALVEYRTMLVTARDRMAKLVADGKSEDDVVAAKPFADLDAKWAPTELASKNFVRVVYHSLADKPEEKKKGLLKRLLKRS